MELTVEKWNKIYYNIIKEKCKSGVILSLMNLLLNEKIEYNNYCCDAKLYKSYVVGDLLDRLIEVASPGNCYGYYCGNDERIKNNFIYAFNKITDVIEKYNTEEEIDYFIIYQNEIKKEIKKKEEELDNLRSELLVI